MDRDEMLEADRRYSFLGRWAAASVVALLSACGGGQGSSAFLIGSDNEIEAKQAWRESSHSFSVAGEPFAAAACAKEGGTCLFRGAQNVAYGANGRFTVKKFTGAAPCNNTVFGDPVVGMAKQCFLALVLASTSPASSAPAPGHGTPVAAPAPVMSPPTTPGSPALDLNAKPSKPEAARFLVQATFGPTVAEIDRLAGIGYPAWIDEQFGTAAIDSHWAYTHRGGPPGCTDCNLRNINAVMESFWMQAVRGPDQLRQRLALALSEIFVVSAVNNSLETVAVAHAGYLDMLSRNAFGNFRTLLEQVATHPAMGSYLSHLKNDKEDVASGRLPDENFARELMQLFSIGLWELNEDGSRRKDAGGNDIPTYSQAEIMGMAKVFTGWSWGNGDWESGFSNANPADPYERAFNQPMVAYPARHSTSEKKIVRGVVIPANTSGAQSLKIAIDTLFNHPNVGPFIGSQLIKRLVTSNPSPAYIQRVSRAFNDNGSGVRGDMKAVVKAVLLDPEARDPAKLGDPQWGKLREPMIRYANFMRAFDARTKSGVFQIWNLEDTLESLGQNPFRAPSVFNWFRPDYAPPGEVTAQRLVAPEFQITHETTTTGYANFMSYLAERHNIWYRDNVMAQYGPTTYYLAADYSAEMALAKNPAALLDRLNLLLMAGQMTAPTRQTILEAVTATPADAAGGSRRVGFAVYLIMQSPEFIVQK